MISLILVLALLGLLVWLLTTFLPMPPKFSELIVVVAIVFAILLVLQSFGVFTGLRTPSVRL